MSKRIPYSPLYQDYSSHRRERVQIDGLCVSAILMSTTWKGSIVFGQEPQDSLPRQIWFVAIMVLLLLGLVAAIALGWQPGLKWSFTLVVNTPKPTVEGKPTPLPTAKPTSPATATAQARQTADAMRYAIAPTPTPSWLFFTKSPLEEAPHEEHYFLERPIAPDGTDFIAYTYAYGSRGDGTYPIHHGVEFVNPIGTKILAVGSGTIVVAGDDATEAYGARTDFYGRLVILKLDTTYRGQPIYVLYGHLSEILVEVGQKVRTGDVVGLVGMAGIAEGPHVHLEVRYQENDYSYTVNPILWLRPFANQGTLAGEVVSADGLPVSDARIIIYRASDPRTPVRELATYPPREANPDPSWGENFCVPDLTAGQWVVEVQYGGRSYTNTVTVTSGQTAWLTVHVSS